MILSTFDPPLAQWILIKTLWVPSIIHVFIYQEREREKGDIEKIIEASLIAIISYKSYIPATKKKQKRQSCTYCPKRKNDSILLIYSIERW